MPQPPANPQTQRLAALDHAHVWHPFTPMRQWREKAPLIVERGEGPYLFDTEGRRYIDGVSSLWCNVHGHAVPAIDDAIREQLGRIAHTTLLGLASPPSIELAQRLVGLVSGKLGLVSGDKPTTHDETTPESPPHRPLTKVFYTDAGATAVEAAFKMAVGYWHHEGQPQKQRFIGLRGAYHGDTVGAMSVGYSDLFHRAFKSMVFPVDWFDAPDALRPPAGFEPVGRGSDSAGCWPSQDDSLNNALGDHCLNQLEKRLEQQADQTAAVVLEPVVQGAAGMVCQPPGFVGRVAALARRYNVLFIADEVAVGFGRTGRVFACEHDRAAPDILCLAKGLTAGYLPLAVTMTTDAVYEAFTGELSERKALYHGHTYTGNPLACAAALAGLDLFEQPTHGSPDLVGHIQAMAALMREKLEPLRACLHVRDVRQRGMMVGIELGENPMLAGACKPAEPFDFSAPIGHAICDKLRGRGVIIRPLGNIVVLMPICATPPDVLAELVEKTVDAIIAHV